ALVWGTSVKHCPQNVGKEHVLADEDVVQILKKIMKVYAAVLVCLCMFAAESWSLPRRSDDSDPNVAVIQQLVSRIDALEAGLEAEKVRTKQLEDENGRRVAFAAYMTQTAGVAASRGAIIPFSGVLTNIGHAYDPTTSAFTAPYDGAYMFFVQADISADYRDFLLERNGSALVYCHNDGSLRRIACGSVFSLKAGDRVTVVQHSTQGVLDPGRESVFSGFRIH
ncbi:hypothetical protein BaRGS_00038286, partial [Batillaria attramentaria]